MTSNVFYEFSPPSDPCPACQGVLLHDDDCPLASLTVARAAELGLKKALALVKQNASRKDPGP